MIAHVLLNLLNEFRKKDKIRGLPSILFLFREFNNLNNTGARILDSIYHMTPRTTMKLCFGVKMLKILPYMRDVNKDVIT